MKLPIFKKLPKHGGGEMDATGTGTGKMSAM